MTSSACPLGLFALASALLAGCAAKPQPVTLLSLESSGRMSFLCLGKRAPDSVEATPRDLDDCPDQSRTDNEDRSLYSLVTQPNRGEVAVVNLTGGVVVDEEPTIPGFNFLPIGAQPTSIVSTPGSMATFVGVAEVGKEGIFALPSSCVSPRHGNAPLRDITTWPSCRLPSAPGDMALLIDPVAARTSCTGAMVNPMAAARRAKAECPADLSLETRQQGHLRKLAVALPDAPGGGEIVILDAQAILDLPPGAFPVCTIEGRVPLRADLPATPIAQRLPADLVVSDWKPARPGPLQGRFTPMPAGFAQLDDPATQEHKLFVADLAAPVIHVLDTSNPCDVREEPPLLPRSFIEPGRVVTTTKVAVSPLIPPQNQASAGPKRYLYAIDQYGSAATPSSVMIFDVSPGSGDRTPLLRTGSALLPFEPPDRIAFTAPARDVAFALRDTVAPDPVTGIQKEGVFCDPDPRDQSGPGVAYRPAADLSAGARAGNLRGVFGFVALDSGQIATIDVEDFDRPCRRPRFASPGAAVDFRGCSGDPDVGYFTAKRDSISAPTVTDETSCNVVEVNRERSAVVVRNDPDVGVRAPALRGFPRLVDATGRSLATDDEVGALALPRMLGVDFSPEDRAEVYVGTTLYARSDSSSAENPLVINPKDALQSSLVLNLVEPRAYAPQEDFRARFEGVLVSERPAATLTVSKAGTVTLQDGGVVFCDLGIEAEDVASVRGTELHVSGDSRASGAPSPAELFGRKHADYVRIMSDLPDGADAYWATPHPECGAPNAADQFLSCRSIFGTHDAPTQWRELRVTSAARDELALQPRTNLSQAKADELRDRLSCCFPAAVSYEVRASHEWVVTGSIGGFRHAITTDAATGACVRDRSPLKSQFQGRVIEVSCRTNDCYETKDPTNPKQQLSTIGPPDADELDGAGAAIGACIFDGKSPPPLVLGDPRDYCMFKGLTARFTIYRGESPSLRDWEFDWTEIGGFSPLFVDISAASDASTSPSSMVYSPQQGSLVLADGSSKGLVVVDLSTFAPLIYR